jgi:hypothetical protein
MKSLVKNGNIFETKLPFKLVTYITPKKPFPLYLHHTFSFPGSDKVYANSYH